MAAAKFDELKAAIFAYGDAAFQNLLRCRALADDIVNGFARYEGCDRECVSIVPPTGEFDPRKDYQDEAFSFQGRDVIILEPVRFGISLIVGNAEDSGAMWLRTMVSMEVTGETFDIYVAARPVIRVPLEFEDQLLPVFEAIHREFLETFTVEVNEFNDTRYSTGIGFLS